MAVTLGAGEEREVERILAQLRRFLGWGGSRFRYQMKDQIDV